MAFSARGGVIQGQAELQADIRKRVGRLRNPKAAYAIVADLLELHIRAQFDTQGAIGGNRWRSLKRRTVLARTKRWGYYRRRRSPHATPTSTLLWTGALRRSFRRSKRDHIRRITSRGLTWGSDYKVVGILAATRPIIAFRSRAQMRSIMHTPVVKYMRGESRASVMGRARRAMS